MKTSTHHKSAHHTSAHHAASTSFNLTLFVLLSCLAFLAVACGGTSDPSIDESSASEPTASPSQDATTAESDAGDDAVEYEPAYPEDVSTDELSESDAAQQHGHAHDDAGEHEHGDDGDHDEHGDDHPHGDEGDQSHGDDEHSH